ncbi:chromosomal replication initiator protein DnaA [Mesoplasma photuris]|uniref:chromosomal replication initiator protein DnaA n=1 Tax=Mesoplasma photuris TaxID=217731 RepID=UPI0004E25A4F|nr:chromosomal replication initiator protein DnaA [Mesoplasma photuris]
MEKTELWLKIKDNLANNPLVDQAIYNDYLAPSKLFENENNEYLLIVSSKFGLSMVEAILPLISEELKSTLGKSVILSLQTRDTFNKTQKNNDQKNKPVNDKFTFSNFVVGESNSQAFFAAEMVSKNPGQSSFNPLFIYGDSGLGKTHLLKAIKSKIDSENKLKVVYLSSEMFIKQVQDIIHQGHKEIEAFKESILENDMLIIDDVQFLAKKEKTNEIFFTIFNSFIENDKQLVFSSDKSPDALNGFDNRIITRFNLGLTTSINILDIDTAIAIIENEIKIQGIKVKVDDEAIKFLASYYADDVRKIKGSIAKINFWWLQNSTVKLITLDLISQLFKDVPTSNLGVLNIKKIKEVVSEKYGVTITSINGKARTGNIVNARHVAMYLTKDILGHSLNQIGTEFGGKDHTTVINAVDKITKLIASDNEFSNTIEVLKNKILTK